MRRMKRRTGMREGEGGGKRGRLGCGQRRSGGRACRRREEDDRREKEKSGKRKARCKRKGDIKRMRLRGEY